MPLKYQIDTLDGVDEAVKGLYTEKDGKFVLGIEGLPQPEDVSGLKGKVEELLAEKKAADAKRKEAEEAAKKAAEEAARKSGDVGALEKSWQEKLAARESELNAELERYRGSVVDLTSGQAAVKLAAELAVQGSADVLLPHIKSRLRTEFREGQPVTVVLDKDGKPSAATVEDLKKEFISNKAFAPLIAASKASGAGRSGGEGGGAVDRLNLGGTQQERVAAIQKRIDEGTLA